MARASTLLQLLGAVVLGGFLSTVALLGWLRPGPQRGPPGVRGWAELRAELPALPAEQVREIARAAADILVASLAPGAAADGPPPRRRAAHGGAVPSPPSARPPPPRTRAPNPPPTAPPRRPAPSHRRGPAPTPLPPGGGGGEEAEETQAPPRGTSEETPAPPQSSSEGSDYGGHAGALPDPGVKQNPGGTEAQALKERRLLSRLNWPLRNSSDLVWHDVDKPRLPDALRRVQQRNATAGAAYASAVQQCASGAAGRGPKHAAIDVDCFQRQYWEAARRAGGLAEGAGECTEIYSYPSVQRFRESKLTMCSPREGQEGSEVSCHVRRLRGHGTDTAICEARDTQISFDQMPPSRNFPWLDFKKGAFTAACEENPEARRRWRGMFIQCIADWFNLGWSAQNRALTCDVTVETPTYFVTRAGDYSPFHIAHDLSNAFISAAVLGVPYGGAQVVILDRMTKGFYLPLWQWVATPRHRLLWYADLREKYRGKRVCYRHAVFNIPARLSLLYNNHESCISTPSSTLRALSDYVLGAFSLADLAPTGSSVVITVIVRRNYKTGHPIGRRFGNEDEVLDMLRSLGREVIVNPVDYAQYDFDTQLSVSRATDFLVAMHGAGLIQMLFLPPWGGVFEFFCPEKPPSNFRYRHLAGYMGLQYDSFSIPSQNNVVPIEAVRPKMQRAVRGLRRRKGLA